MTYWFSVRVVHRRDDSSDHDETTCFVQIFSGFFCKHTNRTRKQCEDRNTFSLVSRHRTKTSSMTSSLFGHKISSHIETFQSFNQLTADSLNVLTSE